MLLKLIKNNEHLTSLTILLFYRNKDTPLVSLLESLGDLSISLGDVIIGDFNMKPNEFPAQILTSFEQKAIEATHLKWVILDRVYI